MGVYSTQMLHGAGIYTYIYPKKWPKRRWRFHTWSTWDICFLPKSNCWPLERTSEAAKDGAKLNRMGSSGGYSAMCLHMFWRYLEGHAIQPTISDVSTQKKPRYTEPTYSFEWPGEPARTCGSPMFGRSDKKFSPCRSFRAACTTFDMGGMETCSQHVRNVITERIICIYIYICIYVYAYKYKYK